jgi:hypothetical protein
VELPLSAGGAPGPHSSPHAPPPSSLLLPRRAFGAWSGGEGDAGAPRAHAAALICVPDFDAQRLGNPALTTRFGFSPPPSLSLPADTAFTPIRASAQLRGVGAATLGQALAQGARAHGGATQQP